MFWHNCKYQLKIILHDRGLVFWTLAFPLIMATLFHLAFSNIESSERLQLIKIAIIDNAAWQEDTFFRESFAALSRSDSENQLFETTYIADRSTAEQLLRDDEVSGILELKPVAQSASSSSASSALPPSSPSSQSALALPSSQFGSPFQPEITVQKSDVNVTIFKSVVDQLSAQAEVVQAISAHDPRLLAELATVERAHLEDASSENLSYTMIEYYSLIAMTCLYGGMLGMVAVNYLLANMSASGKRIAVSPAPKSRLLASGLLASYLVQLFGLLLLFSYTVLVLHVDYGNRVGLIILLALIGSLTGLALGAMLASVFRVSENTKVGLMLALTMFGCFLAGMMGITMKYLVDTNLPLLNQLNPANLITDGLYSLYYYTSLDRFWSDIMTLVIITLVIISVSVFSLRKEQYDNL